VLRMPFFACTEVFLSRSEGDEGASLFPATCRRA